MKQEKQEYLSVNERYEHSVAVANREMLQTEINKDKVNIDRTVFSKSADEKTDLKIAKKQWRKYNKF